MNSFSFNTLIPEIMQLVCSCIVIAAAFQLTLLVMLMLAPCSHSNFTPGNFPLSAALCNGASPSYKTKEIGQHLLLFYAHSCHSYMSTNIVGNVNVYPLFTQQFYSQKLSISCCYKYWSNATLQNKKLVNIFYYFMHIAVCSYIRLLYIFHICSC